MVDVLAQLMFWCFQWFGTVNVMAMSMFRPSRSFNAIKVSLSLQLTDLTVQSHIMLPFFEVNNTAQSNNSIFGHSVWHGMVRSLHETVI